MKRIIIGLVAAWGMLLGGLLQETAQADVYFAVMDPHNYTTTSTVLKVSASGNRVSAFAPGELDESIDSMTVGPNHDVYALQNILGSSSVSVLSPTTGQILGDSGIIHDSSGDQAYEPESAAFGPDGFLYVVSASLPLGPTTTLGTNNIFRVDPNTFAATEVVNGITPQSVSYNSVAFSPNGPLYFLDYGGFNEGGDGPVEIGTIDLATGIPSMLAQLTSSGVGNYFGSQLAIGANGNIYLTSVSGIEEYSASGTFLTDLVPGNTRLGPIEFGPDGDLYAYSNSGLEKYDPTTGKDLGLLVAFSSPAFSDAPYGTYFPDGFAVVSPLPEPLTVVYALAGCLLLRRRRGALCGA